MIKYETTVKVAHYVLHGILRSNIAINTKATTAFMSIFMMC